MGGGMVVAEAKSEMKCTYIDRTVSHGNTLTRILSIV